MPSMTHDRTIIDIGASKVKHKTLISDLRALSLTRCDTVADCFGIGKAAGFKAHYWKPPSGTRKNRLTH